MSLTEWNRHNIQNSGYHLQLIAECFPSAEKKGGLVLNTAAGVVDCVTDGITEKKDGGTGQTAVLNSMYDLQKHKDILDQMADIDLVNMVRRLDSQKRLLEEKVEQKDKEIAQTSEKGRRPGGEDKEIGENSRRLWISSNVGGVSQLQWRADLEDPKLQATSRGCQESQVLFHLQSPILHQSLWLQDVSETVPIR